MSAMKRENEKLKREIEELRSRSMTKLSFDSVVSGAATVSSALGGTDCHVAPGRIDELSKALTNLPAQKLLGLAEAMEACGVDKAWDACVRSTSRSVRKATAFGMRNALTLVLVRCATSMTLREATWAFGLGQSDRLWLGDLFKTTIKMANRFYSKTVAVPPTLRHLDGRELPAFLAPALANFGITLDATNLVLNFRILNADGSKDSYSDYYGASCGKIEVGSLNDGTVGWISFTYGGAASEFNIVEGKATLAEGAAHVSFRDYYADFEKRWG